MSIRRSCISVVALAIACATAGCATAFKYSPKHESNYSSMANRKGLAIRTGRDSRPVEEKRPAWARDAETIVARALADETRNAKLFHRVTIHADSVALAKYSEIVSFRIAKFECYSQSGFFENAGRELLRSTGFRGELISESIPVKYVAEVALEFEVLDAVTQQQIFAKSYVSTKEDSFNGYQGETPKIQLASAALEQAITAFVADLARPAPNR